MLDVVTIGDGLITLNPKSNGPLRFVNEFERKIGGAELNFAIGTTRLGAKTGWISRLGNDEFGKYILQYMRGEGVDVEEVKLVNEHPTSLYVKEIKETGDGRSFYYRDKSPTRTLTEDDINEDYIKNAKILHVTGVFPSICDNNAKIVEHAIKLAKKHGVMVSLDPNIRLKLWSKKKARAVLTSYLPYVDILLTGMDEAALLFETNDMSEILKKLEEFPIRYKVFKKGSEGSVCYYRNQYVYKEAVPVKRVIDTVGAGDGFDAGFIHGLLKNWDLERILTFANAVGAMVVSVSGDNEGLPYEEEVLNLLGEYDIISR